MKKNQWEVQISFIDLNGKKVIAYIRDEKLSNILDALNCVPTAKVISIVGERRAA
jgi:hypothetical protein